MKVMEYFHHCSGVLELCQVQVEESGSQSGLGKSHMRNEYCVGWMFLKA